MIPWSIYDECQQRLRDGSMDKRLQELMRERAQHSLDDLTAYLYHTKNADLPTWLPLINATVEQAYHRGHQLSQGLLALMPSPKVMHRNTDGLS